MYLHIAYLSVAIYYQFLVVCLFNIGKLLIKMKTSVKTTRILIRTRQLVGLFYLNILTLKYV